MSKQNQEDISSCMGSDKKVREFPDQAQRAAVCYSKVRNNSKSNCEFKQWANEKLNQIRQYK